jgi:hypothetical protein
MECITQLGIVMRARTTMRRIQRENNYVEEERDVQTTTRGSMGLGEYIRMGESQMKRI